MQLPASITLAAVENFLTTGQCGEEVLLPTNGKHQAAGAEAALVQALATWANGQAQPTIRTYASSGDDVQIERLARRLYGMSALALADRIKTLAGDDITDEGRAQAIERMRRLAGERPIAASRGPQLEIVCADHLAISHPASLYTMDALGMPVIKGLPSFLALVKDLIIDRLIGKIYRHSLPADFERTISVALYELIRNTEEHGRTDDLGNTRLRAIRGFQARKHSLSPESLASITAASPPLAAYCRSLMPARAQNSQVQIVELSVFDTGPGLAPSLTGSSLGNLSRDDELVAVRRCFAKNVSRKHTSASGLGLPNLSSALTAAGGFMRLRTGRCALYADFAKNPVTSFGDLPYFENWFPNSADTTGVAGTLFTLIFPLKA